MTAVAAVAAIPATASAATTLRCPANEMRTVGQAATTNATTMSLRDAPPHLVWRTTRTQCWVLNLAIDEGFMVPSTHGRVQLFGSDWHIGGVTTPLAYWTVSKTYAGRYRTNITLRSGSAWIVGSVVQD